MSPRLDSVGVTYQDSVQGADSGGDVLPGAYRSLSEACADENFVPWRQAPCSDADWVFGVRLATPQSAPSVLCRYVPSMGFSRSEVPDSPSSLPLLRPPCFLALHPRLGVIRG